MAVALTPARRVPADDDVPRLVVSPGSRGDAIFRGTLRVAGLSSFVITALILIFLIIRSSWAFRADGLSFFTKQNWIFVGNDFGIGGVLPGTLIIGAIASLIAIPVALATAIYISEYSPGGCAESDRGHRPDGRDPEHHLRRVGPLLFLPRAIGVRAGFAAPQLDPAVQAHRRGSSSSFVGSPSSRAWSSP